MAKRLPRDSDGKAVPLVSESPRSESRPAALFGQRLKAFRSKKGWTQEQLAEVLEISQQEVSLLEASNSISPVQLSRLRRYGLDVDQFLDEDAGSDTENKDAILRTFQMFESLYNGGISEVHPTRAEGLQSLKRAIQLEDERIDLTGSSLKGLVMNREIMTAIADALRRNKHLRLRILITHPALAILRAFVEGRQTESIRSEIQEAIDTYYRAFLEPLGKDRVDVRVALHPPTIFAIFLVGQRKALVNPYTLTIEAYSTPSLIIRDTGNENCMYRQFHQHHFEEAWHSRKQMGPRVTVALKDVDLDPHGRLFQICDDVAKELDVVSRGERSAESRRPTVRNPRAVRQTGTDKSRS